MANDPDQIARIEASLSENLSPTRFKHILGVREVAVRVLEGSGYTVRVAGDGEEAVRVFEAEAESIALAVLDVVMPRMGGREAYDLIKRIKPDIRALFTSGYSMNAVHSKFVLHEGVQLIQKPYGPSDLLRKVRDVLDRA